MDSEQVTKEVLGKSATITSHVIDDESSTSPSESVLYPKDIGVSSSFNGGMVSSRVLEQTRTRRIFSFFQIFFFALTFMSSWEAVTGNLYSTFYNGGPQTLTWGIIITTFGAMAQSASLAEMASVNPIAGAQYHWTYALAPPSMKRFITWMQGWITWFGWISTLAGIVNITAWQMEAIVTLNYPDFAFERWHTTLLIFAMLFLHSLVNIFAFRAVPWIELFTGFLHITCFFVFTVVLLVTAEPRHTSEFVWFSRADPAVSGSGWYDSFIGWNVALSVPTWCYVGFDGAVHLSEEVKKARNAIPWTMFLSIALNGVLAFAFVLVLLYTMGTPEEALNSTQPFYEICLNATGSLAAATAMASLLVVISYSVTIGALTSISRLTWAWSRDGALPGCFSTVSPKYHVPVYSIMLSAFIVALLAILNIASTVAFGAFIALATIGIYVSYFIAIACMAYARLQPGGVKLGSWNVGRFGMPINIFALVYTAYITFWLPWPSTIPVTGTNLNYSLPIFAFVVLFALVSWFAWARKHWRGISLEVADEAIKED